MAMQTQQLAELLTGAEALASMVPTNAPYRPAFVGRWPAVRALFRLVYYIRALWSETRRCELVHVMANSGWSWHLYAVPAIWIARLRRVPVIVNYRGGEAAKFLARSGVLVRFSMRQAAKLIVPSGYLQEVFSVHGMPAQIVPNIVSLERFHPGPAGSGLSVAPRLLVARNLEAIYDNASAIVAFTKVLAAYPSARLTLAGTGPLEADLRRLANEMGVADSVYFPGRLGREAMANELRSSTVAINPSTVDNMPNSVLEALASGVPVVSTRVGGVPHIVEHGVTAILVPPSDPDAMASALLQVLADRALRAKLAAAGLAAAKRYSWDEIGPQWMRVYLSATTGASRRVSGAVHG